MVKCSSEVKPFAGTCATTCAKNSLATSAQQTVKILGEGGRIPDFFVQVQSHKPAKQHAVIDLLHQQPLVADRVPASATTAPAAASLAGSTAVHRWRTWHRIAATTA